MKDREAVMTELFDLKRAHGFKSNYEDFKCSTHFLDGLEC
jgi:hypothetical protein